MKLLDKILHLLLILLCIIIFLLYLFFAFILLFNNSKIDISVIIGVIILGLFLFSYTPIFSFYILDKFYLFIELQLNKKEFNNCYSFPSEQIALKCEQNFNNLIDKSNEANAKIKNLLSDKYDLLTNKEYKTLTNIFKIDDL